MPTAEFIQSVAAILQEMQDQLLERARKFRHQHTLEINSSKEFSAFFESSDDEKGSIHGGFALSHVAEDPKVHEILKELKVTSRCIPLDGKAEKGKCIFTGKPSEKRIVFAKAY